jgi:hypothetical protein
MKKYILFALLIFCATSCFKPCEKRTLGIARFKADGVQYCRTYHYVLDYHDSIVYFHCSNELQSDKTKNIFIKLRMRRNANTFMIDFNDSTQLALGMEHPFYVKIRGGTEVMYTLDSTKPYSCKVSSFDSLQRRITLEFSGTVTNGAQSILLTEGYSQK